MGWWGNGSDENDDTYNELGVGILDRFSGVSVKQVPESLKAMSDILNNEILPDASWRMGVVIWGLRQHLTISEAHLQGVQREMTAEMEHCDEDRKTALQQELLEVESALQNGGQSRIERRSKTLGDRLGGSE